MYPLLEILTQIGLQLYILYLKKINDYLSNVTHPLSRGKQKIGFDTRIGLKVNLQPKLSMESLKNETDTIGLLKNSTIRTNACLF